LQGQTRKAGAVYWSEAETLAKRGARPLKEIKYFVILTLGYIERLRLFETFLKKKLLGVKYWLIKYHK